MSNQPCWWNSHWNKCSCGNRWHDSEKACDACHPCERCDDYDEEEPLDEDTPYCEACVEVMAEEENRRA